MRGTQQFGGMVLYIMQAVNTFADNGGILGADSFVVYEFRYCGKRQTSIRSYVFDCYTHFFYHDGAYFAESHARKSADAVFWL